MLDINHTGQFGEGFLIEIYYSLNQKKMMKMKLIKTIQIFLLVLILVGLGLLFTQKMWVPKLVDYILSKEQKPVVFNPQVRIVGGDRDVHGCIGSAGYSWCSAKNKCLRVWEEKCE